MDLSSLVSLFARISNGYAKKNKKTKKTGKQDEGLRKKRSFIKEQKIQEEERAQTKRKGLVNTRDKDFEKTVEKAVKNEKKIRLENIDKKQV